MTEPLPDLPDARPDPLDLINKHVDMLTARRMLYDLHNNEFIVLDLSPEVTRGAVELFMNLIPACFEPDIGDDGEMRGMSVDVPQFIGALTGAGYLMGRVPVSRQDLFSMPDGALLRTHPPDRCEGEFCCVHKPSDHPLNTAPLNWRGDVQVMERTCDHGIGHPDPDHLTFVRALNPDDAEGQSVHGCDGCCVGAFRG